VRLFCFPYAGGGASVFYPWARGLPAGVEVCAVQLPGREARLREAPIADWDVLLARLSEALAPFMDRPFALYGHSLGAAVAFELARRLRRDGRPPPFHLFVSGHRAPHCPAEGPELHALPDDQLIAGLRRLSGTPEEVLQHAEILALLLPLLRADFALAERYEWRPEPPLPIPITAYSGADDEHVPVEGVEAWREHTSARFRHLTLPGGHFFPQQSRAQLLADIARAL
jgi:medium-chain acyl-[acyl-carrier-protein] hydrolase